MPTSLSIWIGCVKYGTILGLSLVNLIFRKKRIPEINDKLLRIPAVDLAELIRTKQISSVQLVEAYINAIKLVDPVLKAVTDERFAAALEDAIKADELCNTLTEKELKEKYPLLGVPFTVKEAVGVKGMTFHMGAVFRKNVRAEEDGSSVKLLKAAGAIVLAVTSVPEWTMSFETDNHTTGRTLNPYNTKYTPGGSSGGESALIGVGASVFGMGTDFMGSIRLPSLFTGIFGHRPTRPLIDIKGALPLTEDKIFKQVFCVGPMCRYAKDLQIITKLAAGPNAKLMNLDEPVDLSKLKIYYSTEYYNGWDGIKVTTEILESVIRSVFALKTAGAEIKNIDIFKENLYRLFFCKYMEIDYSNIIKLSDIPNTKWALYKEYNKWLIGASGHTFVALFGHGLLRYNKLVVTKSYRNKHIAMANELRVKLKELLDCNSVIIMPTFPTPAYKHYGSTNQSFGSSYLMLPSIFNLPATAIPLGLHKNGLPLGIQVVANEYQDRLCFAVAEYLEKEFGGWVPPNNA